MQKSVEGLLKKLKEGVKAGEFTIFCEDPKPGRFAEEFNLDLAVSKDGEHTHLLHAKVFGGRGYYREWVEIFGIKREVMGVPYFGSELEKTILDLFSFTGRIFVEYFEDKETTRELSMGVPPALSRLGFDLAMRGYTWFKDWYFPEGLMEGGHKLQGEKTDRKEVQVKRLDKLRRDLGSFLETCKDQHLVDSVLGRFKILEDLWKREFL